MCKKKKHKKLDILDFLAVMWLLHRSGILKELLDIVKTVEESSDKNSFTDVSIVGKNGRDGKGLKGKSESVEERR